MVRTSGKIKTISVSKKRGVRKRNVKKALLRRNYGILGDAHSGKGKRQVSLLQVESIERMRKKGLKVKPGDFAENITTAHIDLSKLKTGKKILIGERAVVKVSQIGKECRHPCRIFYEAGDCIMPKEGIFVQVIKGGKIIVGDQMEVLND